jgi:hypothetical protein
MTAFIITSLIIGVILLCVAVYNAVKYDNYYFVTIIAIAGIYLLCSILYFALSYPTDNDVRNGTAEYVKTHHIEVSSNDTIEYDLYRLEWINQ